jgi:hypothetical protein
MKLEPRYEWWLARRKSLGVTRPLLAPHSSGCLGKCDPQTPSIFDCMDQEVQGLGVVGGLHGEGSMRRALPGW